MNDSDSPETSLKAPRRAAISMLARREHSRAELQQKLQNRFADLPLEDLECLLDELAEASYQSDERFLESYVRYRSGNGHGPLKIKAELSRKGLSGNAVEQALYGTGYDWRKLCNEAMRRRFREPEKDLKSRVKYQRFLAQRGFDHEDVRAVIEECLS